MGWVLLAKGEPEVVAAVDSDQMSVTSAAKLVEEPPEVQREIAAQAKKSGGRYRMPTVADESEKPAGEVRGVGVERAHEAIACLKRIPKDDGLRDRAFQIVSDWIKHNK